MSKIPKSKNLNIRVYDSVFNFIEDKANELGITKTDFFISQIDQESELASFMLEDKKRLKTELIMLEAKYEKKMASALRTITANLVESDNSTLVELYDSAQERDFDPDIKEIFQKIAKERGITLPD